MSYHPLNDLPYCANMLSSTVLSGITNYVYPFSTNDSLILFNNLLVINAKLCLDRYGSKISKSVSKVEKLYANDIPEIQVAGFIYSFQRLVERYLDHSLLSKSEEGTLSLVKKLYRNFERSGYYKSNEISYYNTLIYTSNDESIETQTTKEKQYF